MYPPDQAPALKLIYEARAQLVRQNEAEIEDLNRRLEEAIRRQKELVELMADAKANYEEASSKIVDLLDDNDNDNDNDDNDDSGGYDASFGNESKHSPRNLIRSKRNHKHNLRDIDDPGNDQARGNGSYEVNRGNESKHSPPWNRLRNPYVKKERRNHITPENPSSEEGGGSAGYGGFRGNESKYAPPRSGSIEPNNSGSNEEDAKPSAFELSRGASIGTKSSSKPIPSNYTENPMKIEVVDLQESDDDDGNCETGYTEKTTTSRTSSPAIPSTATKSNEATQRQEKPSPANEATGGFRGRDRGSDESSTSTTQNPTVPKPAHHGDQGISPTTLKRPRSSSTGSFASRGSNDGGGTHKKRAPKPATSSSSSSSTTTSSLVPFSRRIKLRPRPSGVPPDRWLKSSVGRTPEELNRIDDMVQYMGSCKFGKSVVVSLYGKVYAMVLNDESNTLAQRTDEFQFWYVCPGPGRMRDARLVYASPSTIPIFHAPKVEYTTKELFYVGHYRVTNLEELNPPVVEMEKERDVRVTLAFDRFDERLDAIIKRGSDGSGEAKH